uniref:NADH-ubiquinone oxidoreductase chain 4 n=1 Tax=Paraleonnates uschakovi TaxID=1922336 RepID=A0A343A8R8_9ANNE|nr:NADH dehydrogenase subunit 4 [Paraleonnates uschakovi]APG32418.1 NADH dehydrogenase subunit 4 [Paraleonnates uschakovi]
MLKLILPMTLLLLFPTKWNTFTLSSSMLAIYSLTFISSHIWPSPLNPLMSIDPMSSVLVILTLWITPLLFSASQQIFILNNKPKSFSTMVTSLSIILITAFSVNNFMLFYIMFEASLIPTLLIIMTWGYQPERIQAGMYLMLYTITGSLPLLMSILFSYSANLSLNIIINSTYSLTPINLMWFSMNMAFLVKLPMFGTHLWLPKAHVEAPVAGSMVLAAILLKLGGYGMLRLILIFQPLIKLNSHMMISLGLWGGTITSFMCVRQTDMKSLIAYSSVGHMSLVMAGILTNNSWGMWGALALMVSHGLLSSSLFAAANLTYEMSHSRNLLINKGIHIIIPSISMMWFIMCAMNMAAPPSINLMAEIMLISATLSAHSMLIPLAFMSYLAAVYSLILYTSINHGFMNSSLNFSGNLKTNMLSCFLMHLMPVILLIISPILISVW